MFIVILSLALFVTSGAMTPSISIAHKYFARLQLDPAQLDPTPTLKKLQILQETHLARIPFENTAQHGVVGPQVSLNVDDLVEKILDQKRGGFCYELNGLFSVFLHELGYTVNRIPACVSGSRNQEPTHMTLVVGVDVDEYYLVEVGFGEPPIHPLKYETNGEIQITPEGMQSKIDRCDHQDDTMQLYWFHDGEWKPRFSWEVSMKNNGLCSMKDFEPGLQLVLDVDSIFSEKLIVCKITREQKLTLAGNRFKLTVGRFNSTETTFQYMNSNKEARDLLCRVFGIPLEATNGLDLKKSLLARPETWSHA